MGHPKVKGIIYEKIKKDPGIRKKYIILITGRDTEKGFEKGHEAGTDNYIKKPFKNQVLNERLEIARKVLEL